MQFGCSACDYMHGKQSLSYSATHVCKSFGSTLSGGIKDKGPYTRAPFGVALWPNALHLLGCRPVRPRPRHPCTHQVLKLFVHLTWAIAAHCPEAFVPLPAAQNSCGACMHCHSQARGGTKPCSEYERNSWCFLFKYCLKGEKPCRSSGCR